MISLQTPYEMAIDAAKRFKETRTAKKITIKALSAKSGVPYSTIRRFENSGEISFMAFVKLASAIDEDDQITGLFADRIPASIEEVLHAKRR